MRQLFVEALVTQAGQHVKQYPMTDQSDPDQKIFDWKDAPAHRAGAERRLRSVL